MTIDPKTVINFWNYTADKYDAKIKQKTGSSSMRIIGRILVALSIMSYRRFMKGFVTTIKRTIYVPFRVGTPSPRFGLWDQVVIAAHESTHVKQYKDGGWKFLWNYLRSSTKRANYECKAYHTSFELIFWRYGVLPGATERAKTLKQYGCTKKEIKIVGKYLRSCSETIRRGGVTTRAGKDSIAWLEKNAPKLRIGKGI